MNEKITTTPVKADQESLRPNISRRGLMAGKVSGSFTKSALAFCGPLLLIMGIVLPIASCFFLIAQKDFLFFDGPYYSYGFEDFVWLILTALVFVVPGLICLAISEGLFWLQKISLSSTGSSE